MNYYNPLVENWKFIGNNHVLGPALTNVTTRAGGLEPQTLQRFMSRITTSMCSRKPQNIGL